MELAWKRQAEEEAALAALASLATTANNNEGIGGGGHGNQNLNKVENVDSHLSFAAKRRLLSCPVGSVTRLRSVAHLVRSYFFLLLLLSFKESVKERQRERKMKT